MYYLPPNAGDKNDDMHAKAFSEGIFMTLQPQMVSFVTEMGASLQNITRLELKPRTVDNSLVGDKPGFYTETDDENMGSSDDQPAYSIATVHKLAGSTSRPILAQLALERSHPWRGFRGVWG